MTDQRYEAVIGLEIHAELLTRSKMFCGCSADYGAAPEPNVHVCPTCGGLPGALPAANKRAIEQAVLVGLALNCTIQESSGFARKNYFYPDLPKGYQISQYELPLAAGGWLEVQSAGGTQRVRIRRAHLEEDTAKSFHHGDHTLIDYNRAGVPLLEIVSEPDIRSVEAALDYATKVRAILRYLGVNSGDMEKGVLRFEANVSMRPAGSEELRTRTEIKNLNSFRAMSRACEYEIQRQIGVYESGGAVRQETLGWDDLRGTTVSQRSKEHAHDYRYFPEPDLPPLRAEAAWVNSIAGQLPELPGAKTARLVSQYGLRAEDARLLCGERTLADYFESVVRESKSPATIVSNWVAGEFLRYLGERAAGLDDVPIPARDLAELIDMVTDQQITSNTGKAVLAEMFKAGGSAAAIVKEKGLDQVSDEAYLQKLITRILDENPKEVAQYLAGKETILQWLMGQVARATQGKADPQIARDLLTKALALKKEK